MPAPASYGALLDALRGVIWPARHAVTAGWAGSHHSRLRGIAPEFTEYRPFRQGDDPRRLDWKLLARADRAYLRLSDDRSTLTTLILLDASASMGFPEDTQSKWEQACRLSVGLAAVSQAHGDPVGLLVPREGAGAPRLRVPPRSHRRVVAEIAGVLGEIQPDGGSLLTPALQTERWPRRVVVISDFLGDSDALLARVRELVVDDVDVAAVHVVAEEELAPASSPVTAVDPEDPALRRVFTEDARGAYSDTFAAWRSDLAGAWRAAGATFHQVLAEEATAPAIRRLTHQGP